MASVGVSVNASCASIALLQNLQPACHPCSIFACRCFARFARKKSSYLARSAASFAQNLGPKANNSVARKIFLRPRHDYLGVRVCLLPSVAVSILGFVFIGACSTGFADCELALHPAVGQTNLALRGCQKRPASGNLYHVQHRQNHPPENRSRPHRAVPLHHVSQDRRGDLSIPSEDQHSRGRLARVCHQPLDR